MANTGRTKDGISITFQGKAFVTEADTDAFFEDIKRAIHGSVRKAVETESKKLVKKLKSAILTQTLPHAPLSPRYKRRKIKQGFDGRIGVRTKSMVKSLKFFEDSPTEFFVGIRRQQPFGGKRRKGSKTSIPTYARRFEFGTRKQPARPFFRPVLRSRHRNYIKRIVTNINSALSDVAKVWSG
jgi:HK97 gp10 family phage protein